MAAISTVTQMLNAGDHVLGCDDVYSGTFRALKRYSKGIISFLIKEGLKASKNFFEKVKIFSLVESLGGVE